MIGLGVYLPDGFRVASLEDIENWESEREMYEPDVRLFVALFSYNPAVMSPNPETMEEELPFQQGQIIKVKMMFSSYQLFCYLNSQSAAMHHVQIISVVLRPCCVWEPQSQWDMFSCRYMEIKTLMASIAGRLAVALVLCRATWYLRFLWKTESLNVTCSSRGFYLRRRLL